MNYYRCYKHYRRKHDIDILADAVFKPLVNAVKPQIKGFMGEFSINLLLNFLDSRKYKVLSNIIIQSGNSTTQIDHILVSNYGIFVMLAFLTSNRYLAKRSDDGSDPSCSWTNRSTGLSPVVP